VCCGLNAVVLQGIGWQSAVDKSEKCIPANTQQILRNDAYQAVGCASETAEQVPCFRVTEQGADN